MNISEQSRCIGRGWSLFDVPQSRRFGRLLRVLLVVSYVSTQKHAIFQEELMVVSWKSEYGKEAISKGKQKKAIL